VFYQSSSPPYPGHAADSRSSPSCSNLYGRFRRLHLAHHPREGQQRNVSRRGFFFPFVARRLDEVESTKTTSTIERVKNARGEAWLVTLLPVVFKGGFLRFGPPKPACKMVKTRFLVVFLDWARIIPSYPCQNTPSKQGLHGM
jgi:hypothetical protein